MHWFLLAVAIAAEIVATTLLKMSAGFTKPLATIGTVLGYSAAFYTLSLVLRHVPLSRRTPSGPPGEPWRSR